MAHASSEIETIFVNATLRDVVITASSINFIVKAPKNGKNLPKTTMLKSIKGIPVANILIDPLRKFITKYASLKKGGRQKKTICNLIVDKCIDFQEGKLKLDNDGNLLDPLLGDNIGPQGLSRHLVN